MMTCQISRTTATRATVAVIVALCFVSCADVTDPKLDDQSSRNRASSDLFQTESARVILDNDAAFATKLAMVEGARTSIDMAYYLYWDDYSSSAFSEALLAAVERGVNVRLLLDYANNYPKLDLFSMLEEAAAAGPGSFTVRFYNRPTRSMIRDAAFLTMGCSPIFEANGADGEGADGEGEESGCDDRKLAVIEEAFANDRDGSNLDVAKSGLFLSGWYGRRPDVMALAVTEGQGLDLEALTASTDSASSGAASSGRLESLKKLASTYWRSRSGSRFQRVTNRLKLSLAMMIYGRKIDQMKDTVSDYLPIHAGGEDRDWRDWEYLTDYMHQKLLLVDGRRLVLGGRNMGDSYHMSATVESPHPYLHDHELFYDTDLYAELPEGSGEDFRQAFERMWGFDDMVARLDEVRRHAPNDFVANRAAFEAAEQSCADVAEADRQECTDRAFAASALDLEQRHEAQRRQMAERAEHYRQTYTPADPPLLDVPAFDVDAGSYLAYFENVPFDTTLPAAERRRTYGSWGFDEVKSGKYLTRLWRDGMTQACQAATAEKPKRVVFVNAYYLPPANLLRQAAMMIDSDLDCRHVTVQVVTNSASTSNFEFINLIAYHGLKAFSDFYREHAGDNAATFEFYEYLEHPTIQHFCLHSKVTVLGDDVVVGSANADARSYMMDANNGMLILGADDLRERYLAYIDSQIARTDRVRDAGAWVRETDREVMKEEHLRGFRGMIAKTGLDARLSAEHLETFEEALAAVLDEMYRQTTAVLEDEEGAIDRYNRLFKLF